MLARARTSTRQFPDQEKARHLGGRVWRAFSDCSPRECARHRGSHRPVLRNLTCFLTLVKSVPSPRRLRQDDRRQDERSAHELRGSERLVQPGIGNERRDDGL